MRAALTCCVIGALVGALGCGREVAQTASREPTPEEQTSCESSLTELPNAPKWLTLEAEPSPLVSEDYGAGEGPGLWITARDAYRVYLNGALAAESKNAREPAFVPLSLLPGDNELLVAVWAAAGAPAALLQVDDLDRSYVSDASFGVKVETGAATAVSLGRLGALPGCDPKQNFPNDSIAEWIGPALGSGSSALLKKTIRLAPVGYGQAATGGGDAAPVVVSSWEELEKLAGDASAPTTLIVPEGLYDFRRKGAEVNSRATCPSACTEDPEKQQFAILGSSETCPVDQVMKTLDERRLAFGSNKTLVGLGRGALLRGVSLDVGDAQNVVIRNVAAFDVNRSLLEAGDGIGMQGAKDVWVDHVTLKWISDGITDLSPGTQNVTLSWLRYDGVNTDSCRGRHTHAATFSDSTVTVHHTLFDHTDSHAPLVSNSEARVHVFNDLIQDNAGYGVAASCGAQVLLEGTTMKTVMTPTALRDCADMPPLGQMSAAAGKNLYLTDVGKHAGGDGTEPKDSVFEPPYDYADILEPAASAWPKVFERAGAGGRWALPLSVDP
jgi:pectate lyase